jgi:hypothetical protein
MALEMTNTAKTGLTPSNGTLATTQSPAAMAAANAQVFDGALGSVNSVRAELADVLADMKDFHKAEPDEVMSAVSAHGARLVEIKILANRLEVQYRQWKPVVKEVEDVLAELRFQFQVASRQLSVRQLDQSLIGGSP